MVVFLFTLPCLFWKWVLPIPELSEKRGFIWFTWLLISTSCWSVCFNVSAGYINVGISDSLTRITEIFLTAILLSTTTNKMIAGMKLLPVWLGIVGILSLYQKYIFVPLYEHKTPTEMAAFVGDQHLTKKDPHSFESQNQLDTTSSFDPQQFLGVVLALSAAVLILSAISTLSNKLQDLNLLVLCLWTPLFGVVSSFLLAWSLEPNWALPDYTKKRFCFQYTVSPLQLDLVFCGSHYILLQCLWQYYHFQ